jgi:hypothetical protein
MECVERATTAANTMGKIVGAYFDVSIVPPDSCPLTINDHSCTEVPQAETSLPASRYADQASVKNVNGARHVNKSRAPCTNILYQGCERGKGLAWASISLDRRGFRGMEKDECPDIVE